MKKKESIICHQCGKEFRAERWKHQKYCSIQCGINSLKGITYKKRICVFCNSEFKIEPWRPQKYCSKECAIKALRTGKTYEKRKCLYCGREFLIEPFKMKKYCSRKCMGLAYKGNRKKERNNAPQDGNGKYIHRMVMENYLGRKLLATERVHHIDMNKLNNELDNLYIYSDESQHQKGHKGLEKLVPTLLKNKIIRFVGGEYVSD